MTYPPLTGLSGFDPVQVAAAEGIVRAYCGWHIAPVITEDFVLPGTGGDYLNLPTCRLVDLPAVVVDGVNVPAPEWTPDGTLFTYTPERPEVVAARMTHGFDTAPDEVVDVVRAVSATITPDTTPPAAEPVFDGYSTPTTRDTADAAGLSLSEQQQAMLAPYRLRGVT